ncbi:MAG TPA: aldo/keto reductase [Gammaproteobacteria bacterium]|nr:aldo/keto reductase [Gammaproteobacteria bacterium]
MFDSTPTRRQFLSSCSALGLAGALAPGRALAQMQLPQRVIPATGEALPVIGLGSSKGVSEIAERGTGPLTEVLRTLVEYGGRLVDTWPRDPDNDAGFGSIINLPDLRNELFVTSKIDRTGREQGIAQFEATLQNYGRERLDLVQIFSLTDLDTHWPSLRDWKERGLARYIGVTVAEERLYEPLEDFLGRAQPDFIQVNYSITERSAEERILPLAADRGIAVLINRPFMNGSYFRRLEDVALPDWTTDFDCSSWAQFSLKYILANQALTCVLTETSNPVHMAENAMAAFGDVPDEAQRERMRRYIDSL